MELVHRDCPVCCGKMRVKTNEAVQYTREFHGFGPKAEECCECGVVFLNPVMTDEGYREFYNNDGQRQFVDNILDQKERGSYKLKVSDSDMRRAQMANMFIKKGDRVLDVGTGNSDFTKLIENATGIDLNKGRVANAILKGLDVRYCDLFEWDESADVITMFHVLEHITDPVKFLLRARSILNDGGTLIVEVPNLDDALVSFPKYRDFYYQNAHCTYFNTKTLRYLMRLCSFNIVKEMRVQRYSLDNHLHWLFKGKPGRFNKINAINSIYSYMLRVMNKHDTIFLVCKKGEN